MIEIPEDLRYTDEHEWIRVEGYIVIIGITDYAQDALGEIVYIELPSEGDEITKGNSFGGVESTKSVSDLYAPVSGEVVEINEALLDSPETINEDPYGGGWMIKVSIHHSDEIGKLMTNKEYAEFIEREVES